MLLHPRYITKIYYKYGFKISINQYINKKRTFFTLLNWLKTLVMIGAIGNYLLEETVATLCKQAEHLYNCVI